MYRSSFAPPKPMGMILYRPGGTTAMSAAPHLGHRPVFFVPEKAKTFGQLTAEEKSAISHRGKALKAFSEKLATYLGK